MYCSHRSAENRDVRRPLEEMFWMQLCPPLGPWKLINILEYHGFKWQQSLTQCGELLTLFWNYSCLLWVWLWLGWWYRVGNNWLPSIWGRYQLFVLFLIVDLPWSSSGVILLYCNGYAQCYPTQVLQDLVRIIQKGFTLSAVAFTDYVDLLATPFASEFRKREHVPPVVPANICLCDKLQLLKGMIRN